MQSGTPDWVFATAAVVVALPCGWGLGIVAATCMAGSDFGQLPAVTVPLGIVAALVFALSPILTAKKRLTVLLVFAGT
ncbi:MAG: hypothetical protein ACRETM_01675 [Stenotrophobium sp.]